MIRDPETGAVWGQAREVARELCLNPDTGPELVRSWGRRNRIASRHIPGAARGTRLYCLDEAIEEERRSRLVGTGRPRT